MDQGLFAVSNFVLNIMLARWLAPEGYGAFSVAYTVFLLLGTFHTALLTEPMLVFGSGKYASRFSAYLGLLLRGHWGFTALAALIFALAGLAFAIIGSRLAPVLLALSFTSPFVLFQWIMRRACYVNLQPRLAAYAGGVYLALVLAGAWLLYSKSWLSAASALGVMALASLFSGGWLVYSLRGRGREEAGTGMVREAVGDHWGYGKWAVGAALLSWVPGNIYHLLLPVWGGLEASAAYRALLNLFVPIMHVGTALGGVLLPALVKAKGHANFRSLIGSLFLLFIAAPLVYWLVLGFFGDVIVRSLYAGNYLAFADLLWIAGVIPVLAGIGVVSGAALRALERPKKVFLAFACATGVALTIGLLLVSLWGVDGALLGWAISYLVTSGIMTFMIFNAEEVERRVDR